MFIQTQTQALQAAQQKINDLQSAEKKAEDDREKLLKELQAIKAQKDMEVASAIQRGKESFTHKTAGTSSSNSRHQPTRPNHSLAPLIQCSSPILPNHGAISTVSLDDDQRMQQDPLLDTPLPTPAPPDVPAAATSEFPSRQVSQTPDLQRWSWVNARDKKRRERSKKRMTLTKLCPVRLNLSIVQG
jgi:hypothetical protein